MLEIQENNQSDASWRKHFTHGPTVTPIVELGARAVVEPDLWREWTDSMVRTVRARGGQFWVLDRGQGEFCRNYFSFPDGEQLRQAYRGGWDRFDPVRLKICEAKESCIFHSDEGDIDGAAPGRFLKWQEKTLDAAHSLTLCVVLPDNLSAGLTLYWSRAQGAPTSSVVAAMEAVFAPLVQQLQFGLQYGRAIDDALWHAQTRRPDEAILWLSENGNVMRMTKRADALVSAGGNLVIRDDRLAALVPSDNYTLQAAVEKILQGSGNAAVSVHLRGLASVRPLTLVLSPLEQRRRLLCGYQPAAVASIIGQDIRNVAIDPRAQIAFRLTAREAQVAAFLKNGFGVEEAAAELRMSPQTMRVHMRNLYRKVNVDRQVQLIRLLHLV